MTQTTDVPIAKIGCSAVLSNDDDEAVHGRHILQAVSLAVEQANAQRTLPVQLEVAVGDDKADPEQAVAVAKDFIADAQVVGVVGTMNSHTSLAAAPHYDRAGLVQIAPAASAVELTRRGFKTFFRVVAHDGWQSSAAANYAVSVLGAQRIAVIHDGTTFGEPLAEMFREKAESLGADIVRYVDVDRGQTDFQPEVASISQVDPDLIFFGVIEAEGRLLAQQLREAGVRAIYFGTDGLKPSHFLATPDYAVSGPYHTNAGTDVRVASSAQSFADTYRQCYGSLYSVYTAEAYDAAQILINAVAHADPLDRAGVRAAVARTRDFEGATGRITFDANGDVLEPRIGLYRFDNGEMVFLGYTHELLSGSQT